MGSEFSGHTIAHPVGIFILIVLVVFTLKVPRYYLGFPLLFLMVAIPSAQRVVVATLDFNFIKILVLVCLARIYSNKKAYNFHIEKTDIILNYWMFWSIFSYGVLIGGLSGVVSRTGFMITAVGSYYIGRACIRTTEDIKRITIFIGLLAIPMVFFFLVERGTGKNMFSIFGGVPDITLIRNGRLRCQGPFSHPIMAGVFWASFLPWLGALWFSKTVAMYRVAIFIGCVAIIIANTASSTPVMSVLFTLLGFYIFTIRGKLPVIRKSMVLILVSLHLVMEKPVWHLISRIDISGGSTGWHRYHLIQESINHIGEWWLVGTLSTAHWGYGLGDVTNQYLLEGVRGGLAGMVLFTVFLFKIFTLIGRAIKVADSKEELWIYWASGIMLFVHMMNFLAVSYFGQVTSAFFFLLGGVVSVTSNKVRAVKNEL
mgnify:CR=1 FL=1